MFRPGRDTTVCSSCGLIHPSDRQSVLARIDCVCSACSRLGTEVVEIEEHDSLPGTKTSPLAVKRLMRLCTGEGAV